MHILFLFLFPAELVQKLPWQCWSALFLSTKKLPTP